MTAVGFSLFFIGLVGVVATQGDSKACGLMLLSGLGLAMAGFTVFLWRVMP